MVKIAVFEFESDFFFDVISEDLFSIVYNKEQFAVKLSYHKLQQQQVTDLMQK